jgi:hypothetical protein
MQGFGQPDLCWMIRETVRSGMMNMLKKKTSRSSFHFVYGADILSQSNVITYFQPFLNDNKGTKLRVTRGAFCIFDIFSKKDIRIEVKIPGSFTTYVIDETSNRTNVNDIYWRGAFLSSMMRYFRP